MLSLGVQRHGDQLLDPDSASTVLFYDETVTINLASPRACKLHLYVTVLGNLKDREREHSVVIYDEDLPKGKSWSPSIHVRHPRSPLQHPHLEIVATAHYTTDDHAEEGTETKRPGKYLEPFLPVTSAKSSFVTPFSPTWHMGHNHTSNSSASNSQAGDSSEDTVRGKHDRGISTTSGIDFAEAYEERKHAARSELVTSTPSPGTQTDTKGSNYSKESQDDDASSVQKEGGIEIVRWKAPLVQALELEIRSLRPALERDRVIAEVDLVSGSFDVSVNNYKVELEEGLVDLMGNKKMPISLAPREKYAMCYNLQLRAVSQLTAIPVSRKPLSLSLECEVLLDQPGVRSNPIIKTSWTPIVDFEGTHGPIPKTPALNMAFSNSPAASAFPPSNSGIGGGGSSSTLDLVGRPRQTSSSNLTLMGGVSIIITGPQFVTVGETFSWNFKIINRSQRMRLFTITFGSSSRDPLSKDLQLPSNALASMSSYNAELLRRRAATHYRNIGANRGILPLCQELRVGNLAPHVCFETKIELIALSKGTHAIETTKIEDLSSRDSYDVGSLLDVIVLPAENE